MSAMDNEAKEFMYHVDGLVDTLWNEYESSLNRFRKRVEDREDTYLQAVEQTRKTSEESRQRMEDVYRNVARVNRRMFQSLMEAAPGETLWLDIGKKLDELSWSPVKYSVELMSRAGKQYEVTSKEWIEVCRESRNAWSTIADGYMKLGRDYHRTFLRGLEDTTRSFPGSRPFIIFSGEKQ